MQGFQHSEKRQEPGGEDSNLTSAQRSARYSMDGSLHIYRAPQEGVSGQTTRRPRNSEAVITSDRRPRYSLKHEELSLCSDSAQPIGPPQRRTSEESASRDQAKSENGAERSVENELNVADLVIGKRYGSQAYSQYLGERCTRSNQEDMLTTPVRLEAGTGVLLDDAAVLGARWRNPKTSNLFFVTSQENDTSNSTSLEKQGVTRYYHCDTSGGSVSTVPDPPSLRQGVYYSEPGAFRILSGEVPRGGTSDDVESLIGSFTSHPSTGLRNIYETTLMVEASLVNDDPVPDDECSSSKDSANFMAHETHVGGTTTTNPLVEALPMEDFQTVKDFFRTRKVQCILLLLAMIFVFLSLGTAYAVNGFSKRIPTNSSTPPRDMVPTNPPTLEGDLTLEYFVQVALPGHTRLELRRENSPQTKALRWLRNNTFLESYDLSRRMQRFALATFYFSTSGDRKWKNKKGWLSDDDECTWFFSPGQDGDNFDVCSENMIRRFSLAENSMHGTFPLEISFLGSLEELDMSSNMLSGFLPTTLGQMSSLRSIQLFDNYLSGTVPMELGDATSLEVFDVEYNLLAQILPETLGRLSNLKELLLDRNMFRGSIPSEFAQLSRLEKFYLFVNDLSGTIPRELGNLSSLQSVRWEVNRLSGKIPTEIGLWKNAFHLSFGNNTLEGTLPSEIGALSQLTYLDLFENSLTGSIPAHIGQLTNMEHLYLEENSFKGSIPTELGNLKSLELLWMHTNDLTGSFPTELGELSKMTNLDLSFNKLTGTLPTVIGLLSNLETLSLEHNSFTGRIPSELGLLSKLQFLVLHGNDFTGVVPDEICYLKLFGNLSAVVVDDCSWFNCLCCTCSSDLNN